MPLLPAVGLVSPILTTFGSLAHGYNMISAKPLPPFVTGMLVCLGWLAWSAALGANQGCGARVAGPQYGPTTPGGYYVRVEPRAVTMAHNQRPQLTVAVADAAGRPVEDVLVTFTPSEGTFTTSSSRTRGGTVVGTFVVAPGNDSPRTASLVAAVENVAVTVFIDIVPVVYQR
jgi:hypothetical protein